MSTRGMLRRKVVLAVTVIRCNGKERQLAHTLDITETSARLGGLTSILEPGEMVEIQRGALKARFQVVWMGETSSPNERQAGVRSMEPSKVIWGVNLPDDELDRPIDIESLRTPYPAVRVAGTPSGLRSSRTWAEGLPMQENRTVAPAVVEAYPARVLVKIVNTLVANFDEWQNSTSAAEMQELREAIQELHRIVSPAHQVELIDFLATTIQRGGTA